MSSEESEVSTRGYSPSRRRFLELISYLLGAIAAGLVAIPIVGAYLSPLLAAPPGQWRRVGKVSDFPVGNFVEATFLNASPVPWSGVTAKQAVWLRRAASGAASAKSPISRWAILSRRRFSTPRRCRGPA